VNPAFVRGSRAWFMSNSIPASDGRDKRDDNLPPIGQTALVQGDGFRCLAYRDKDGKWRDAFHKRELKGSIQVIKPH
jgi:hypothetical protein